MRPLLALVALALLGAAKPADIGRHEIRTVPTPDTIIPRSATYTPSGKVLVTYFKDVSDNPRAINLATMNDDGSDFRPFFSAQLPVRPKDNGIRYMVFQDNRRIFLGDFVLECSVALEQCSDPLLLPVEYPAEVADGDTIARRWSEMIIAPDNRHVAWTTLLTGYAAAAVLTGELRKSGNAYTIVKPQIVSTIDGFKPDPKHPDGVIPQMVRGGEVKQFIHGGTAISFAGAIKSDLANSTVQHLATGKLEAITDTPGYTETTIFSPDERLGLTMSTRFSAGTDLAVLGLLPKPHPTSLNMGLSMFAYTYGVQGVRRVRAGSVGPALIDIQQSKTQPGYLGINLNTSSDWVFGSPMSWHPSGKKAMWMEIARGGTVRRFQILELPNYRPGKSVRPKATPSAKSYASSDLSAIPSLLKNTHDTNLKVYGRASGVLTYRRTATRIEKVYSNYSDEGSSVWTGIETMDLNPTGNSTYAAKITITGDRKGSSDLQITFGPLAGALPAEIIFAMGVDGLPQSRGFAEYAGTRLSVDGLVP